MNKYLFTFISIIYFTSCGIKQTKEDEILVDTLQPTKVVEESKPTIEIDSAEIKRLTPKFDMVADEFDVYKRKWYQPKSRPKFINQNHIYCYFEIVNGKPTNYRLKVQYVADDWLFIKRAVFLIDDQPYEIIPGKLQRDNGGGYIWEWFDEPIQGQLFFLMLRLSQAKSVSVKYYGTDYTDVRKIPQKQLQSISETFKLYWAMGGRFQ